MTRYLQMTASCFYLWILRSFSEHFFNRTPLGNWFFHVQVAEFQQPDTVKNYFTDAFQAFYTRTGSSHSKAFIYLKSLKIICEEVNQYWSCKMPTCKFTKNFFTHPTSSISPSQNASRLLLSKDFESVQSQLLSGNISESSNTCNLPESQLSSCWIWHLTFSWVQFLSNKLQFFVSCNIIITRTSFFLLFVLICTFL